MSVFESNEKLKEKLVMEYGAFEAKTIYFKHGVFIMPEPFLETIVVWKEKIKKNFIIKSIQEISSLKVSLKNRCYISDIQYEIFDDHYQLIWTIFKEDEEFFENQ